MRLPKDMHIKNRVEDLPMEEQVPFLKTFFSFGSIIKSAMPVQYGTDAKGRKYIECMLFERTSDNPLPGDTIDETLQYKGRIYLFDDESFGDTLPSKDQKEEKRDEFNKRKQSKKRGFFKKLFGFLK